EESACATSRRASSSPAAPGLLGPKVCLVTGLLLTSLLTVNMPAQGSLLNLHTHTHTHTHTPTPHTHTPTHSHTHTHIHTRTHTLTQTHTHIHTYCISIYMCK